MKREVIDITKVINDHLMKSNFEKGLINLYLSHTTCALSMADLDPGTEQDYLDAFEAMIPKLNYRHPHNPSHFGDHLMSTVIGASLTIPIESASMVLGQWQKLILIELAGPKERRITLTYIPEPK